MTKHKLLEHWRTVKAKKRNRPLEYVTCCIGNSVNGKEFDSLLILQVDCDKPVIVVEN